MSLVTIQAGAPTGPEACRALEQGDILFWSEIPFDTPEQDIMWLRGVEQANTRVHKNISYRPATHAIRGAGSAPAAAKARLARIMERFSASAAEFLGGFLGPYQGKWTLDYASFRPIEEAGRDLPLHKRNELLHVDAFPTRPVHGGRILRFFLNINAEEERVWRIGGRFRVLAAERAEAAGLKKAANGSVRRKVTGLLNQLGLPVPDRSAYDEFMLRFHDSLKEDKDYQASTEKTLVKFPPMTAWAVYTDGVPHSVLSGRLALEQTFIVPFSALVAPKESPLHILEELAEAPLV